MSNIRISQLPTAPSAITGAELVPIVQNGQTVQTTITNITNSPVQTQTFLTVGAQASLPNSRYIGGGLGIGTSDGGAQGVYSLFLNGTSASLENASTGIIVKSAVNTVVNRSIAVGTAGLSVSDGSGVSGNPTLSLTGLALSAATLSGNGMVSLVGGSYFQNVTLTGTANQISVTNGNGGSNPVFSIANNPVIPGSASLSLPAGDTASRPAISSNGMIRYNTDIALFEGYVNGVWTAFASGSGVTSIATGTGLTGGPITSTGTISIANTAVTAGSYGSATEVGTFAVNAQGQLTAASNVSITPSGIGAVASVSGTANEITATGTTNVTLSLPTALTFTGKTVTGGTLTGVSINGSTNTLSNIANSSLVNSSVTIGSTSIALGATASTLAGLTSVAVTQDPTTALQLATKQYVDAVAEGLHIHASCDAATPATLASITGGTVTYNNGTAGVGATLTLSVPLTILDGYTLLNTNRILVKNEATQANNGIYTWATGGTVLTRATDFDTAIEIASGDYTFVSNGTLYADTGWVQTEPVTTVGSDPIIWSQFSGAGTYTAGTGLTLAGTQFSITNTAVTAAAYGSASSVPNYTVNAQGQLTSASNTAISINANQITSGTLPVANGGTGRTVGNYSIYANEIHVGKDGNDTTGDGTLINPVLTITKALTLIAAGRNTVVVHPGSYSESPTVSSANTTIETTELTGANTQIAGTLTLSAAARISGLKITNLTITGSGNTYISNCTVDTQVVKSGTNYVEIINTELQCVSGVQITGAGIVSIVGNKCWAVAVSNASANVLIKDCFQVLTPSVTAGTLQIDGSAIFAASPASNAVTSSVGSFITLANSFVLNSAGTNVERVSLAGFYSILNLVYDKTNSTFTGTNLNAVDYFSVINTESLVSSGTITAANYVGVAGGVF